MSHEQGERPLPVQLTDAIEHAFTVTELTPAFTAPWLKDPFEIQHTRNDGMVWFGSGYEVAMNKFSDQLYVLYARDKEHQQDKSKVIVIEAIGDTYRQVWFGISEPDNAVVGLWKQGLRGMKAREDYTSSNNLDAAETQELINTITSSQDAEAFQRLLATS